MATTIDAATWHQFKQLVHNRRSIRHFTGESVGDEDMKNILSLAQLAPSSFNTQPYQLHWIKSPEAKLQLAQACNSQTAALTAGTIVVVTTHWTTMRDNHETFLESIANNENYSEKAKAYHYGKRKKIGLFQNIFSSPIMGMVKGIVSLFTSRLAMAPLGRTGMRQWAARNSIWAAQTLLLAAQARGIAACPIEGFNPFKVAIS